MATNTHASRALFLALNLILVTLPMLTGAEMDIQLSEEQVQNL